MCGHGMVDFSALAAQFWRPGTLRLRLCLQCGVEAGVCACVCERVCVRACLFVCVYVFVCARACVCTSRILALLGLDGFSRLAESSLSLANTIGAAADLGPPAAAAAADPVTAES